jgi:hypothetical protein
MKSKAIFGSALAAIVCAVFSYSALSRPLILVGLEVRRRMPDAWFSSSIVAYAVGLNLLIAILIAGIVCRAVYRKTTGQ